MSNTKHTPLPDKFSMFERTRTVPFEARWENAKKLNRALERIGIEERKASRLAHILSEEPMWALDMMRDGAGRRWVFQVRCRLCGHLLRWNQRSWRWAHETKHRDAAIDARILGS